MKHVRRRNGNSYIEDRPYVYGLFVDDVLRYVGKGTNGRAFFHIWQAKKLLAKRVLAGKRPRGKAIRRGYSRVCIKLAKAIRNGAVVEARILKYCKSHEQAFLEEARKIAAVGLANLWNTLSGGEGSSPEDWTEERRKNHSEVIRKVYEDHPELREKLRGERGPDSEETCRNKSIAFKERWARPGEREEQSVRMQKMYEEDSTIVKKIGAATKKCWEDPVYRANQAQKRSETWGPARRAAYERDGVSEEQRQKISASVSKTLAEHPEIKQARGLKLRGRHKRVKCPHCRKIGDLPAMHRWHFDNCKKK